MSTTQDKGKKTYSERMVSQSESNMKLKDSDRYVNKNVGDNLTKERTLSSQVKDNYFLDRHRNSSNSMPDKSFYIDISAITENNSKSGSLASSGLSDSVNMQNSRSNGVSDTTLGSNYEHNKVSRLENGMKLKDTERYVNSDVGGKKVQESLLSEQVKDKVDFSSTIQNDVTGTREALYAAMPISYGGTANRSDEKTEDVLHGSNYEHNKVSRLENGMKLKDTERYVNSDVGGKKVQESLLSEQVKDKVDFSSTIQNDVTGTREALYAAMPISYGGTANRSDEKTEDVLHGSNYEHKKIASLESGMKLKDTERYVNSDVGGSKVQESILAEQVKNRFASSSNIQHSVVENKTVDSTEKFYASTYYGSPNKESILKEPKKNSYEQNKLLNVESTLKVSNTDSYSNKNLLSSKQKAMQLTDEVVDVKQALIEDDSFVKHNNSKKKSSSVEAAGIALSVLRPTIVKAPSIKKVSFSSSTVNLDNLSEKALLGRAVRSQQALNRSEIKYNKYKIKQLKKEKKSIGIDGKSKNVLGKSATTVRRSADFVKNVTDGLQENTSGDDVLMEKSYAISGAVAVGAVNLTKGIVKKTVSVAALESKHKITSNREKKNLVKAQIKELKDVNKTIKNRSVDIQPTYGSAGSSLKVKKTIKQNTQKQKEIDKKLKLTQKEVNLKSKKDKKAKNKSNMKANRKAYIKDVTRKAVIKNLIKPEADRENNLSTGFGGFVASIAKRFMDDFFKSMVKWLLGLIGQIILFVATSLASLIVTLMPIILPIGAAVGVICGLFSFMFGDNTTAQADASYCTTILNNKYNDFNKASHDWLDNNTDTVRGYNVVYADDCSGVNNFQDALLLYIIFSTDNVSSDSSDDSYLVVDSDTEKANLDKAFNMLTYAETSDKTRTVHRKTLADVENSLTANQKKMLELERELVADGSSFDLGERVTGDYADDVGLGSDLIASDLGQAAADYGCKFVGNKYVYGGTDINNGIDCSAFTQYVCGQFGILLPRTSKEQVKSGQAVASLAEAKPGDLIFYSRNGTDEKVYHVTMYIGNGKMVHASNSKPYPQGGIKISNVYGSPYKIRRVFN